MNLQICLETTGKQETRKQDFWSTEQVLRLLRLVRKGNLAKLAEHPLACSKTISSYVRGANIGAEQGNTGSTIYDFVTTLILQRLDELRSVLSQRVGINAIGGNEQSIFDKVESDALSTNKQLKRWSLLAHHYINGLSVRELSVSYGYSTRQVHYELGFARDELGRFLLEQENLHTDSSARKDFYISKKPERVSLSSLEKDLLLKSMTHAWSAPCCAFLWGDWSVLISKKAILVPINKRVTVGLKPSANFGCKVYYWSHTDEEWVLDEWQSVKMARVISRGWLYLSSLRNIIESKHHSIEVYVFSDVPFGSGIHERATMSLCLAACIKDAFGVEGFNNHPTERIAAILESFWYPQVSWAPIVCSSRSPNLPKLIVFDRTDDGGIDFASIGSGDEMEFQRNLFLKDTAIEVDLVDFDVTRLVVLSHKLITIDLDEVQKIYTRSLDLLGSIGFGAIYGLLVGCISGLDYEKVGMIMNLHQDILSTCGFSSSNFKALLRTLRCRPKILGVKPSCCLTTHSALIALVDGNPLEVTRDSMNLVQPISPFLTPTPGLTRIS